MPCSLLDVISPDRSKTTTRSVSISRPAAMTEASTWYAPSAILMTCGDVLIPLLHLHRTRQSQMEVGTAGRRRNAEWLPKVQNDLGVREIRIGSRQLACVGASPPDDHPHIY